MILYIVKADLTEYIITAETEDEAKDLVAKYYGVSKESAFISFAFESLLLKNNESFMPTFEDFKYNLTFEKLPNILDSDYLTKIKLLQYI